MLKNGILNTEKIFINMNKVNKFYGTGEAEVQVLNDIDLNIFQGQICVIMGASGSGKSTLLNVIGGLDSIASGEIIINQSENISKLNAKQLSVYRRDYLGFIFQFYNLIPNLTVKENIQVCKFLSKNPLEIEEIIEALGLSAHQNKFPSQLSGGQQQRCAIARALIKNPKLLLCDEPTGALDYKTSREMLIILEKINQRYGTTILLVTHNEAIKDMAHKVIKIKDGKIAENYDNDKIVPAERLEW